MKLVFAAIFVTSCAMPQISYADPPRSVVTISIATNSKENNRRVYSIPVRYKSKTIQSVLDSGSTPLLVLAKQLPTTDYTRFNRNFHIVYGQNRTYDGTYESGPVSIGTVSGTIVFGVVTYAACNKGSPNCVIKGENATDAYFGGLYPGISGVSISPFDALYNDLYQLCVRRYIISAPRYNPNAEVGQLILSPTANETSKFVSLNRTTVTDTSTGKTAYNGTVSGCLQDKSTGTKVCGAVFLDAGNTGITVVQNHTSGLKVTPWTNGDSAELTLTNAYNQEVAGVDFTVGSGPIQNVTTKTDTGYSQNLLLVGQLPYQGLNVLTDFPKNNFAVDARTPMADGTKGHVP